MKTEPADMSPPNGYTLASKEILSLKSKTTIIFKRDRYLTLCFSLSLIEKEVWHFTRGNLQKEKINTVNA